MISSRIIKATGLHKDNPCYIKTLQENEKQSKAQVTKVIGKKKSENYVVNKLNFTKS